MISLRHKVWLGIALISVALLLGVAAVFEHSSRQTANQVIEQGLNRARSTIEQYEKDVRAKLQAVNAYVSGNSAFKAYMAEAIEAGATESMIDQFEEIRRFSDCDFAMVTDGSGAIVVQTGGDLDDRSLGDIQDALGAFDEGGESVSVLGLGPALYHVVMSPITIGDALYGFVMIGYRIDDQVAEQFADLTACDTAFVMNGGQPRISAASLHTAAQQLDRSALAATFANLQANQVHEIKLASETFRAVTGSLRNNRGAATGQFVALRSVDREMSPFHKMIRTALLWGAVAIALMIPLSFLVSRGITRPLSQLTHVVEGMRQDHFNEGDIQTGRKDEIGVLARAFRELVQELREQRELIEFLEKTAQKTVASEPMKPEVPSGGTLKANAILSGRYRILEVLGKGGMGQVYRAHDMTLDEAVALKTLHIDDEGLREMLKNETKLARRVTHKNVVRTYDFHLAHDLQFVTMEYIEGRTLRQAMRGLERLPVAIGSRIMRQVCLGLHAAHEAGVIHGDVKPDNVMIDNRGVVKVMDFGVARAAKLERSNQMYVTGTPVYMAPEQIMGETMDARSDLYSVGIMMYQVFSGKVPFEGSNTTQIFHGHLNTPAAAPRSHYPGLPMELERVILTAINKKPEHRYQSLVDLEAALAAAT